MRLRYDFVSFFSCKNSLLIHFIHAWSRLIISALQLLEKESLVSHHFLLEAIINNEKTINTDSQFIHNNRFLKEMVRGLSGMIKVIL